MTARINKEYKRCIDAGFTITRDTPFSKKWHVSIPIPESSRFHYSEKIDIIVEFSEEYPFRAPCISLVNDHCIDHPWMSNKVLHCILICGILHFATQDGINVHNKLETLNRQYRSKPSFEIRKEQEKYTFWVPQKNILNDILLPIQNTLIHHPSREEHNLILSFDSQNPAALRFLLKKVN